jgi:hypothetical protein
MALVLPRGMSMAAGGAGFSHPGLRITLRGSTNSPAGIGAQVRLIFGQQRQGPVREIHARSGYWSQGSAVLVMAIPEPPAQIQVRWPGGKTTTSSVPPNAKDISIDVEGNVKVLP